MLGVPQPPLGAAMVVMSTSSPTAKSVPAKPVAKVMTVPVAVSTLMARLVAMRMRPLTAVAVKSVLLAMLTSPSAPLPNSAKLLPPGFEQVMSAGLPLGYATGICTLVSSLTSIVVLPTK
jgi:hypothetical protein